MSKSTFRRLAVLAAAGALAATVMTCGSEEEDPPLPTTPVTLDQLIEACIVTMGCQVRVWPSVSNCMDAYYNLHVPQGVSAVYDGIYHCVNAAAGNCTEVYECYGSNRYAGSCSVSDFTATCEGDKAYSCDTNAKKVFIYDCSTAKLSCQTKSKSSLDAYCSKGSCDPTKFKTKCDGNVLTSCVDGVIQTDDCAYNGRVCGESIAKINACLGNQGEKKTCDINVPPNPPYQASCDGNTALTCENYRIHKEDCSKRVYKRACKLGECRFAGSECKWGEFNKCSGDQLRYCKEGKWITADCAKLGLGPCESATQGANCTPKTW